MKRYEIIPESGQVGSLTIMAEEWSGEDLKKSNVPEFIPAGQFIDIFKGHIFYIDGVVVAYFPLSWAVVSPKAIEF